jgi:hypothetical protein
MPQFPQITSNLSTANFRASVLTQLAAGIPVTIAGSSDTTGSGSVTTSTPFVVTVTNFGTLGFQSNAVATGTVTIEASVDGTNYTATTYTALTSGNTASSFNAATATIGQIDCSAFRNIRFRSNTIVGTVGITYNLSSQVSNVMLDNPLPQGTNVIGGVTLAKAATATRSAFTASSDTQIVAASTTRPEFAIYNIGPAILYIGQGSTAVATSNFTYLLNAGDTYIANPNEVGLEHRGIFGAAGSTAQVTIGA